MGLVPIEAGGVHDTRASPLSAVAVGLRTTDGARGIGMVAAGPVPTAFVAVTLKV